MKPSKIICDMSIINPYQIDRYVDTDRKVIRNGKQERIIDGYIDRDVSSRYHSNSIVYLYNLTSADVLLIVGAQQQLKRQNLSYVCKLNITVSIFN